MGELIIAKDNQELEKAITVEEYVDLVYPDLTKDGRQILLAAIKNDKFKFKYKDKIAQPGTIQGGNMITGLGIHTLNKDGGGKIVPFDFRLYTVIIRERFALVVDRIVKEIQFLLSEEIDPRIKHIIVEATEEDVENLVDRIYSGAEKIEEVIRSLDVEPKTGIMQMENFREILGGKFSRKREKPCQKKIINNF